MLSDEVGLGVLCVSVAILFGYCINRGLYVGSSTEYDGTYHYKQCRYLCPSGVYRQSRGGWGTPEQAALSYCRLFHDGNW